VVFESNSNTLYGKRFFPYYTFNLLCGLDENNHGKIFAYDAIGSFDTINYGCKGSGQQLIQPLLDQQMQGYNKKNPKIPQTKEEVMDLLLDAFHSATERDIYTGDQLEMIIIEPSGVKTLYFPLRKD
jgi:20S proteasome subunit beta 6